MRTVEIKVYQFNELEEVAKQKALNTWRNAGNYSATGSEIASSIAAFRKIFNLYSGWTLADLRTSNVPENLLKVKGVRLYKYLVNNYWDNLFKNKYIKTVDRYVYWSQFKKEFFTGANDSKHTHIYSKMRFHNECVLTGVCFDEDILAPIYKFLERPGKETNFYDLIKEVEKAIEKTFKDAEGYENSDEYIIECIESDKYEFTNDGKIFN